MADIRKLYFDLIDDIYPYAECYEDIDRNMSESEMLYNLIEMEKDMINDSDTIEDRNRINTLIELFRALGIKPIEIWKDKNMENYAIKNGLKYFCYSAPHKHAFIIEDITDSIVDYGQFITNQSLYHVYIKLKQKMIFINILMK